MHAHFVCICGTCCPVICRDLFLSVSQSRPVFWGGQCFHAKMGLIKVKNGLDLTEAEDIKKRWQENTEELYNKDHFDPDNYRCDHSSRERHTGM